MAIEGPWDSLKCSSGECVAQRYLTCCWDKSDDRNAQIATTFDVSLEVTVVREGGVS